MPRIMLCFVRSDSSILESSWLNRAAAWAAGADKDTPPYIHVEILFVPRDEERQHAHDVTGEACSIVYNSTVHLERKRFSRREWVFRSMKCTDEQYDKMYDFCNEHRGEPFNYMGYFTFWSPIKIHPGFYRYFGMQPRWFCSQIVTSALLEGGMVDEDMSPSIHPHKLFESIKSNTMADCGRNLRSIAIDF